jgi:hypothetical protein
MTAMIKPSRKRKPTKLRCEEGWVIAIEPWGKMRKREKIVIGSTFSYSRSVAKEKF